VIDGYEYNLSTMCSTCRYVGQIEEDFVCLNDVNRTLISNLDRLIVDPYGRCPRYARDDSLSFDEAQARAVLNPLSFRPAIEPSDFTTVTSSSVISSGDLLLESDRRLERAIEASGDLLLESDRRLERAIEARVVFDDIESLPSVPQNDDAADAMSLSVQRMWNSVRNAFRIPEEHIILNEPREEQSNEQEETQE
jgi:hypothetical protein